MSNPHVSNRAKAHAQQELNQIQGEQGTPEDQRREGNVKRGLKAYVFLLSFSPSSFSCFPLPPQGL